MTLYDPCTERLDNINESLSLIQLKKGLTFGTDSYLLAAFARPKPNGTAIEIGSGTGVVSLLAVSGNKFRQMHPVEIQPYFASLTERNAALNSLSDRITVHTGDIRDFTPDLFGGEADAVLSNPPYMRVSSGKDNAAAEMNTARREENGTITDFCRSSAKLLKFGGYFTVVYRPDRMAELLTAMSNAGLEPKRLLLVYPTTEDKPCLLLAEGKKGASPGLVVSRPLLIYADKASSVYTNDMQTVYDTFSLEHLF